MTTQMALFDEQLPFEEDKQYTASQITDKIKWYYNNKPFYAINDTHNTTDRIYYCDFKPRSRYMYKGKWKKIKNTRPLSPYEKARCLNVYDKNKHEFRKIDVASLSYLRVGKMRYRVDQVPEQTYPLVTVKRLP